MGLFGRGPDPMEQAALMMLVNAKDETIAELRARVADLERQLRDRLPVATPFADQQTMVPTFGHKTRAVLAAVTPGNPQLRQQLVTAAAALVADGLDDTTIAKRLRQGDQLSTADDI